MRREPFIHGLFEKRNHLPNLFVSGRQHLPAVQAAKTDFAVNELCARLASCHPRLDGRID